VEKRVLNQAVKRNSERFPDDFMIKLSRDEVKRISQFVTSSDIKYSKSVHAFTQEGVAMLSSVLNSKRAIQVNIQIMRVFTRLRQILFSDKDLRRELEGGWALWEQAKIKFFTISAKTSTACSAPAWAMTCGQPLCAMALTA
jgi:uncharacterized membrane-anchored protein YjiN (DUF445 family)